MEKINLFITKYQQEKLQTEAAKTGLSKSEIMRRALDRYFQEIKYVAGNSSNLN